MGLIINNPVGGATLFTTTKTTTTPTSHFSLLHSHHHSHHQLLSLSSRKQTHVVAATGKFTPRTGKFDSRNRRGGPTTTTTKEETNKKNFNDDFDNNNVVEQSFADDGFVVPELPGDKPDLWEGANLDAVGFFFQYMWAFGVVFALVACGIAVATYNEGATDFKQTPAYKESIQSQDLLEEPGASDSDVFESNPTEEAPALE